MTEYSLKPRTELRIEVEKTQDVCVSLTEGAGEIFGSELQLGQKVNVKGQNVAVFSWEGCKLVIEGEPTMIYAAEDTPMVQYMNTHHVIKNLRDQAKAAGGPGPRVLVAGPTDTGKSTVCKILLNWAVRSGVQPTYVDLDVGQGSITAPGSIAATPIETPIDIEEGYPVQVPLAYYFGHASPGDNQDLYKYLVDRMASVLERRAEQSADVAAAGMVINTLGWVEGLGYELLLAAVASLKADVVLVMGQDKLYSQLAGALKGQTGSMAQAVQVVKLPKSGGVVTREQGYRRDARLARVREYFYGPTAGLSPHSQTVKATNLLVFRVGGGFRAPTSALPLGATSKADPLKLAPVSIAADLVHALLGVSYAQSPDQLLASNVAGFVLVTDVDVARGSLTLLAPCAGPLPGRYLIAGSQTAFLT